MYIVDARKKPITQSPFLEDEDFNEVVKETFVKQDWDENEIKPRPFNFYSAILKTQIDKLNVCLNIQNFSYTIILNNVASRWIENVLYDRKKGKIIYSQAKGEFSKILIQPRENFFIIASPIKNPEFIDIQDQNIFDPSREVSVIRIIV